MYNTHRGMMPQHVAPANRVQDLLDQIRVEFETQGSRAAGEYDQQREQITRQQMQEMEMLRDRIMQLERTHLTMKDDYEKRAAELERELAILRGGQAHGPPPSHASGPAPSIGHGPRDLFGQIMAGGGAQGQSSLAPPPQEPPQPQGLPAHLTQNSGLSTGPQPPQHQPYAGYQGQGVNGYGPQPPPLANSPGPGGKGRGRGPPSTSTPQQSQPMPYPGSPRGHGPTPPPAHHQRQAQPPPPPQQQQPYNQFPNVGNELTKLSIEDLPNHLKTVGDDWFAIYNPAIRRPLDVRLLHSLQHQSVVCCVRFSADGRYVATGCNRAAQIFEVESGQRAAKLEDEAGDKDGDLYIRSVCFSPDGKFLATGAEDKCIRLWDIAKCSIITTMIGHEQDIYSLDYARNGRLIASGSGDKTVQLWTVPEGTHFRTLHIDEGVTTVALSPDARWVAAGALDRSVRVWEVESGRSVDTLGGPDQPTHDPTTVGHGDSVYSVAFSPSGRELVSGSLDKTIKLWSIDPNRLQGSARCLRTFEGHSDFVLSVALSPDGEWVLSGSKDRGVVFWNPRDGTAVLHLQGHRNSVISVALSPAAPLFATGSGDSKARIWAYEPYRGPQ